MMMELSGILFDEAYKLPEMLIEKSLIGHNLLYSQCVFSGADLGVVRSNPLN